jgi:hypothetical protein
VPEDTKPLPELQTSPAQAGQPAATGSNPAEVQQTNAQPKYITEEEARRLVQSVVDKSTSRIDKRVEERLGQIEAAYKAAGDTLTPEKRQAAQAAIEKELGQPSAPANPTPAATGATDATSAGDAVNTAAIATMKALGVERFDPSDPEYSSIKTTGTPDEYLASIAAAAKAKGARLTSNPTNPTATAPAGALIGSGASAPDIPNSAAEAWRRVSQKRA